MPHATALMRATDLAAVAATATEANPSGGLSVRVDDADAVTLSCYVTGGGAGAAGAVDFTFAISPDGTNYDTAAFATVSVTMAGVATVQKSAYLPLAGARFIKWLAAKNNDAAVAANNLNVLLGKRWSA